MIQVEGTGKCRGRPKTTLVEIVKKDMSTKEVVILLKIHTRPQIFETTAALLLSFKSQDCGI